MTPAPAVTLSVPLATVSVVVSVALSASATDTPAIAQRRVLVDALRARHGVDRRVVQGGDRNDRRLQVAECVAVKDKP